MTEIDNFKVEININPFNIYNLFIWRFRFQKPTKTFESEDLIGGVYTINRHNPNVAYLLKIEKTEYISFGVSSNWFESVIKRSFAYCKLYWQ